MSFKKEFNKYFLEFLDWCGLKSKLSVKQHKPPFVKEGEIWWSYYGINLGIEINGKGKEFSRPVIIYKKISRESFLVIPLTTKNKKGSWYIKFNFKNTEQIAVLSQIKIISYLRLKYKIGEIKDTDMKKIIEGFNNLYLKK